MDPGSIAPPVDSRINTDDGRHYWEGVNADVNGMLGGFPHISKVDLRGSRAFLAKLGIGRPDKGLRKVERALEGGAGIGRITQGLLVDIASTVDIIEPITKFTAALEGKTGVGRVFNLGLEEWRPADGETYDLIWTQWVLPHLTDQQLVEYLERCKGALKRDGNRNVTGVLIVKENLTTSGADLFDELDSSVTRSEEKYRELFAEAGLRIIRTELQHGFPRDLFPVRMFALKPQEKGGGEQTTHHDE